MATSRSRFLAALASVIMLVPASAALSPAQASGTYTIVSVTDLSGGQASNNGISAYGAEAYFRMLNAQGGINGKQVQYVSLDSQTNVDAAVAAVQKAVTYHPLAILMGSLSVEFPASAPIAVRHDIPVLSSGGMPDSDLYPAHPFIYETIPSAFQSAYADGVLIDRIAKERHISKPRVAITALNSAWGADFLRDLKALQRHLHYQVVAEAATAPDATDFSGEAAKFAAAKPDFVAALSVENFAPIVISALRVDGFKGPFINFFGGDAPALFDKLNDPNYYAFRFAAFPTNPALKALAAASAKAGVSQYRTKQFFTLSWIEAAIVTDALKRCGPSCTSTQLNAQLQKTNVDLRPYSFGAVELSPMRHYLIGSLQPFHKISRGIVPAGAPIDVRVTPSSI